MYNVYESYDEDSTYNVIMYSADDQTWDKDTIKAVNQNEKIIYDHRTSYAFKLDKLYGKDIVVILVEDDGTLYLHLDEQFNPKSYMTIEAFKDIYNLVSKGKAQTDNPIENEYHRDSLQSTFDKFKTLIDKL